MFIILQLILAIAWTLPATFRTSTSIPCAGLAFAVSLVLAILSQYDHFYSERPSTILELYFLYSFVVDIARVRTLWMIPADHMVAILHSVAMASKIPIIVVETMSKKLSVKLKAAAYVSPQSSSSIFSRAVFWWINPIFKMGFRRNITSDDFFRLDNDLDAAHLSYHNYAGSITPGKGFLLRQ